MYECNYSKEPVDYRLFWLKVLKKIWIIPVSIIVGAIVVFLSYFLYKTVISGRTYRVTNIYYIDFNEDSSGAQYTWVNQYTWSELSDMDVFILPVYEALQGRVSKEDLIEYTDCTVEADGRYLYFRTTAPDPKLSEEIAAAYEAALYDYTDAHKEFKEVIKESGKEAVENTNLRVASVSILGALIGLLIGLCSFAIIDFNDTSIYVPHTLEYRYHILCIGAPSMDEFKDTSKMLLEGKKKIAVVKVDNYDAIPEIYKDSDAEVNVFENPCLNEGILQALSAFDAVIVAVKAGNKNGKLTERVIEALLRNDIKLIGTFLYAEDEKLINKYYGI